MIMTHLQRSINITRINGPKHYVVALKPITSLQNSSIIFIQVKYHGYIPQGCEACGGPYPLSRDGCSRSLMNRNGFFTGTDTVVLPERGMKHLRVYGRFKIKRHMTTFVKKAFCIVMQH